ncbi:hypothetical protein OCU04_012378 [Sclerotinia nivalis]|uniref:Uncharacterized protein n=1 Tax=Sclerotinia nivalis TaxID=352851 RepID=A0A9X0A9M7_9HELO|nr:hypothetical protein OCU04_012378 [Sclerotinia nivalis]
MKPLATKSSENYISSPSTIEKLPNNTPSSSFHRIESFTPSSPIQPMIRPTSDPIISEPNPISTPIAIESPILKASLNTTNTPALPTSIKRTVFKLAKQLRNFQGCTYKQHYNADQSHHRYHQQANIHSECSSLQ